MTVLFAVAFASALLPVPGSAQQITAAPADTLYLSDALSIAREASPHLRAERLRSEAAAERVSQAGALPDPVLGIGFMNRPLSGLGTDERMTMNQIQVTQSLPWPGKLGFARQRAGHLASAETFMALEAEVQLLSRVKNVYYELAFIDRAVVIMGRTRELLRDFHQVTEARYRVGEGLQQDLLSAQVAVTQMTEDIMVMTADRIAMAARFNALLGRAPTTPIGHLVLPQPDAELPAVDSLISLASSRRPAIQAAAERTKAATAGYLAARRQLYPDITVTAGYGQRPQYDDMATLMVGLRIPLFAGARQLPLRREMAAMEAREVASALDLYNETFARLTELRAKAERARELVALYTTAILPQARASVESALSAYRVGRVDYMTLVENGMTVNRYEIELERLSAQYQQAVAQIDALLGNGETS